MPQAEGFYQRFGNTKPLAKSPGACGGCFMMVPSFRHTVVEFDGREMNFCDASCYQKWRFREAREETGQIISIASALQIDCCHTEEEVRYLRFLDDLKEMALRIIRQLKVQAVKIRRKAVHLVDELYRRIQRLLDLLGVQEEFAFQI